MAVDRHFHQTLTYWSTGVRDLYGGMSYGTPVQKACRWEDSVVTFQDKQGEEKTSKSKVFLIDDVDLDGYVFLGVSAEANPLTLSEAHEIQQKSRIPDLRNVRTLTTLYL